MISHKENTNQKPPYSCKNCKSTTNRVTNAEKEVEKEELLFNIDGKVNQGSHYGKWYGDYFLKK